MSSVVVVVPFRGGCPHRERAWAYVQRQYAERHPDWQVIEAAAPDGPWCKALAVNPAIDAAGAEIVIQADSDVFTEGLAGAVEAVEAGVPWAIPHTFVHRLSEEGTDAVLRGASWRDQPLAQKPYRGIAVGGFVVASREVMLSIPMDPRFVGWG